MGIFGDGVLFFLAGNIPGHCPIFWDGKQMGSAGILAKRWACQDLTTADCQVDGWQLIQLLLKEAVGRVMDMP